MKIHGLLAVAAATLLGFSSTSHANDVCSALKEIKAASKSAFRAWKGPVIQERRPREGHQRFESSYSLPGTSSCEISESSRIMPNGKRWANAVFSCDWEAENPREANEQYASLRDDVKQCFPDAKVEEKTTKQGFSFSSEGSDADGFGIDVDSYTYDSPYVSISVGVATGDR